MHVLVAGASGAIGLPLVRALVATGHRVTGVARSSENAVLLRSLGAEPAVADALDAGAVRRVLDNARPSHVIHQLTALPKNGPRRARDIEPTNRLRIHGTRNLIEASVAVGVTRLVVGSFFGVHVPTAGVGPGMVRTIEAVRSMESQALDASRSGRMESVILRYGGFYGRDLPMTRGMMVATKRRLLPTFAGDRSLIPSIHIDDAVAATVLALDRGRDGGIYDIVDEQPMSMNDLVRTLAQAAGSPRPFTLPAWLLRLTPYLRDFLSTRVRLSNLAAKNELGWRPRYASVAEGLGVVGSRQAA